MTTAPYRFSRVLAHPVWLAALALLVVNDHVLKALAPGLVTGKLSDVVGLFMAPALLATLLRTHSRRGLGLAHAAIAIVFTAIKLSPLAARGFESVMALGPFPWHITVDPTDLFALPALLLSWRFSLHVAARRSDPARAYTMLASGVGLSAALATSPPPGDPMLTADLVIGSETSGTLVMRIRALRDEVVVDCQAAIRNPTAAFSRALFAPAVAWQVDSGRVVQAQGSGFTVPDRECSAILIDGTFQRSGGQAAVSLPLTLLFYTRDAFPPTSIPTMVGDVPDNQLVTFTLTPDGARWNAHPAVFPAPPELEREPIAGCEPAPAGGTVDWQEPIPVGTRKLEALDSSPDGCHRLTFETVGTWYVCTNTPLPFTVGDVLYVRAATSGQDWETVAGVELSTDGDVPKRVLVTRGPDLPAWSSAASYTARRVPECTGSHDDCGSLVFPLEVTVDTGELRLDLASGDFITLERGTLFLERAEAMPIRDISCGASFADERQFEAVYIEPRVIALDQE